MIVALAIAALELLAVVWACVLLWINAGLRAEIDRLRQLQRAERDPVQERGPGVDDRRSTTL